MLSVGSNITDEQEPYGNMIICGNNQEPERKGSQQNCFLMLSKRNTPLGICLQIVAKITRDGSGQK